jgi:hypothetical protein
MDTTINVDKIKIAKTVLEVLKDAQKDIDNTGLYPTHNESFVNRGYLRDLFKTAIENLSQEQQSEPAAKSSALDEFHDGRAFEQMVEKAEVIDAPAAPAPPLAETGQCRCPVTKLTKRNDGQFQCEACGKLWLDPRYPAPAEPGLNEAARKLGVKTWYFDRHYGLLRIGEDESGQWWHIDIQDHDDIPEKVESGYAKRYRGSPDPALSAAATTAEPEHPWKMEADASRAKNDAELDAILGDPARAVDIGPVTAKPRPAVERPAWAPADATHGFVDGTGCQEVYRPNKESPSGYEFYCNDDESWDEGMSESWEKKLGEPGIHPLLPAAPAPPLAETGSLCYPPIAQPLLSDEALRTVEATYKQRKSPAEPPPAGARGGKTRGEQVYYKLKIDNAYSLPPHQVTIDALNYELKAEYERGRAAALADAEKRGAKIEKAAQTMMGNLKRIDDADGTWMLDRDKALPRQHYANLDRLAAALAQPEAGGREQENE